MFSKVEVSIIDDIGIENTNIRSTLSKSKLDPSAPSTFKFTTKKEIDDILKDKGIKLGTRQRPITQIKCKRKGNYIGS